MEASKVEMEPDQAKAIIAHFTGQLDRIRRSLSYNQAQRPEDSSVPPVASTIETGSVPADKDAPGETNQVPRPTGSRRYRSPDGASDEEEEDDEREGEFMRGLIGKELIPWRRPDFQGAVVENTHPVLLEVNRTLAAWNKTSRSWKAVYQDLLNQPGKPPFPPEQWRNIIVSNPVNLDRVFDRFQSDSITNEISERVGKARISFNGEPIGKGVSCYADWTTAWDETINAYQYIWPSRTGELTAYRRHISSLFHAFTPTSHGKVIKYDRAVRTVAAETRSFLFHQVQYYPQLDRYWLTGATSVADTKEGTSRETTSRRPRKRSSAACRNYNLGVCPNDALECTFRHVCLECSSSGHVKGSADCARAKGKGRAAA